MGRASALEAPRSPAVSRDLCPSPVSGCYALQIFTMFHSQSLQNRTQHTEPSRTQILTVFLPCLRRAVPGIKDMYLDAPPASASVEWDVEDCLGKPGCPKAACGGSSTAWALGATEAYYRPPAASPGGIHGQWKLSCQLCVLAPTYDLWLDSPASGQSAPEYAKARPPLLPASSGSACLDSTQQAAGLIIHCMCSCVGSGLRESGTWFLHLPAAVLQLRGGARMAWRGRTPQHARCLRRTRCQAAP